MTVRGRAPLRISFGGGGTDVSPYCDECGGAVLSTTVNRFAFATLRPSDNIQIHSVDYGVTVSYRIDEEFTSSGALDLASAVVNHFRRIGALTEGIELFLHNDAPPGSGLGSSSAMVVAIVRAFGEYLRLPLDPYAVADLAYRIERIDAGQTGGRQDQYAAAFGGVNFMEFHLDRNIVHPLRLPQDVLNELQYRLVCAYIGRPRQSNKIIERQILNYREKQTKAVNAMNTLKSICFEMRDALLRWDLSRFGTLLHESWQAKREMADGITNETIDSIYAAARSAGALGGKISGAGGGGFMFFLCDPLKRTNVQKALLALDCIPNELAISEEGSVSWRVA